MYKPPGPDMSGYYYATPSPSNKQQMYAQSMSAQGGMPVSMPGALYPPHGSSLTSAATGLQPSPQPYGSMRPQPPNGVQGYPTTGYPQSLASSSYGVPAGMYPVTYASTTLAPTQPAFLTAPNQSSYASTRVPTAGAGYYGTYNPASRMYGYPSLGNQMTSPTYMPGYGAPMAAPMSTYPSVAPVGAGGMPGLGQPAPASAAAAAAYPGASPFGRPLP